MTEGIQKENMLRIKGSTVIDLIDAAYDTTQSNSEWTARVVNGLMALAKAPAGAAFHFTSGYDHDAFRVRSVERAVAVGCGAWYARALRAQLRAPSSISELMLGRTQGTVLATVTRLGDDLASAPGFADCWPPPAVDALGVVARDANGDGFCACVGLDHVTTLSPRTSVLLNKLATHIGAADRLRRAERSARLESAEAVFDARGKLVHALGRAQDRRDSLEDGRRRRHEAHNTTHDIEKALEIWRGLVAGRWSLVDHFDTDGKRFLLAMKNTPTVDKRGDLSPRERRVCALAAMGHRDKEIAYMLGVSLASVTASIHRARVKLGVKTRSELARVWRQVP